MTKEKTRVIFLARLSYVHLTEPWAHDDDAEKKYTLSAIVDKGDTETIQALRDAVKAAFQDGIPKVWKGKAPNVKSSNFKNALKDGDDEKPDDEAYSGSIFLTCSSKRPVPVLNRMKEKIDPEQADSGCFALLSVNFFPFSKGSNGIAAGLNAVLKWEDGEPLGGSGDGARDFAGVEIDTGVDLNDL